MTDDRLRVLYFADLRSSLAQDFFDALRAHSTVEYLALSSRPPVPEGDAPLRRAPRSLRTARARIAHPSLLRAFVGPLEHSRLVRARRPNREIRHAVEAFHPHIVHSLRLFSEAVNVGASVDSVPHVASVWGQEFAVYVRRPLFRTRAAELLPALAGLTADCQRDLDLAVTHGLGPVPRTVLPTNLGVPDAFFHAERDPGVLDRARGRLVVLNPRGIRPYVRTLEYLQAVRLLVARKAPLFFVLADVADRPWVQRFVAANALSDHCCLVGKLGRSDMARLFAAADIVVSPTTSDGTPNTLLEAMASSTFPVFSDLNSTREWIEPGRNGVLIDPLDPESIARGIEVGATWEHHQPDALVVNSQIVAARGDRASSVRRLEEMYRAVLAPRA